MATWAEDTAELAEMEREHRAEYERVQAQGQALRAMRDEITDRRLAESTDEDLLADDESKTWLLHTAEYYRPAARRLDELGKLDHPYAWMGGMSWDNRDETVDEHGLWSFAAPEIGIPRKFDAAGIETLAATMRAWWTRWGMGRASTNVVVMEHTLSMGGRVRMTWFPDEDRATVERRFGDVKEGSLVEMLAYLGKNHPRPALSDEEPDGYEDEDYDWPRDW